MGMENAMQKLLIVDDNAEIRKQLKWGLKADYTLLFAEDRKTAMRYFHQHRPGVVALDLGLPPDEEGVSEGMETLKEILDADPFCKVIVITGRGEQDYAMQSVALGACDFFSKPIELAEIKIILKRAFYLSNLEGETRRQYLEGESGRETMAGLYGKCPSMVQVYESIEKVATTDVPVLVLGESGSGKEMVARAIHAHSQRSEGPFIALNCGAIPETLLEAELFGHEKGAFTGAHNKVLGKVECANGGTLFLDEIGEMDPSLQVKLLRFLQEKVIQRVGGRADIPIDARIVAATNLDIYQAIEQQSFREDLYYRIGVITIDLPPLRERGEDILMLANLFLSRFANEFGKRIRSFSGSAIQAMQLYRWPGNVRELENKVKRAVVMADSQIISPEALGFAKELMAGQEPVGEETRKAGPQDWNMDGMTLREARLRVERAMLLKVVERAQGNLAKSAEILGVSRPTLYDLMKKHGLPSLSQ